ncbi:hypothetical protein ACFVXV_44010, partial [Streptomyces sp. NPDC058272]
VKTGLVNFDQVLFQETAKPNLPAQNVTPPAPQPGEPTVVLTPPANGSSAPPATPTPTPTVG